MIINKFIPFLLLGFLVLSATFPKKNNHEFHISKCLIEYHEPSNALQISIHLFLDDLELTLEREGNAKLYLCTDKEDEKGEEYLLNYLKNQIEIEVNSEVVDFEWVGKEQSEDLIAVWCYMEIMNVSELKQLRVKNEVLMDSFDDQKNIVQIKGPNKKQGYFMFSKGNAIDEVRF